MLRVARFVRVALVVGIASWPTPLDAATFVVTSTADSGAGSLREALTAANGDGEASTVTFSAGLSGMTIAPASALPGLNENGTTIDGDLDDDCIPDVALDGVNVPGTDGFFVNGSGHTITGLSIRRFQNGVNLNADGNTISCNFVGIDFAQGAGFGNLAHGIFVYGSDNTIGPGNVIANNGGSGVRVEDGALPGYPEFTALVPDYTGLFAQVAFESPGERFQTVGGGIVPLDGAGRPFTDNFGMRLRGTLNVSMAGTYTFTLNPVDDFARITVDATVVVDGNGPGPLSGSIALGAGAHSIRVDYFEYGGAAAIALAVGGPAPATFDTGGQPVCATGQPGLCGELFQLRQVHERNRITQNRITGNGDLAIKLRCCGTALPNDAGDTDLGANTWLNHPVLTGIASAGNGTYTLSGTAPPNATVEIFVATGDPSSHGQAGSLVTTTTANGAGNVSLTLALPAMPSQVTASATDALGNTSELGPNLAFGAQGDTVQLGGAVAVVAGTTVSVPVYVRDRSFTPLGVDRPAAERIQGLAFRVNYPAGALTAGSVAPAGVTAPLSPLFGPSSTFNASSVNYVVSYDAATNPIPFVLDAAPPGDLVATLQVTVAADQPSGSLPLTLDVVTELSNQAGTIAENGGNGTLARVDGSLSVTSNAPRGLYARAESPASVRLSWIDPNVVETGFRVERSTDGVTYAPVQDLGADATSHLDGGLAAGTLYYYRVRTLVGAQQGGTSNRATATTFPAAAANVCIDSQPVSRRWARSPDAAFRGPEWGLVYHDRDDGTIEQVYFQRLDGTTLAPLGPRVQVSTTTTTANFPAIAFNGTHYAVTWIETLRGAPGTFPAPGVRFAQLDANGTVLRQPRRFESPPPVVAFQGFNENARPVWDGTHWGIFLTRLAAGGPMSLAYWRLEADGDVVLGPTTIDGASDAALVQTAAAWQPASSEHGVLWLRIKDATSELRFQRVEESTGAAQLGASVLVDAVTDASGIGATDIVAMPGGGWLAAWTRCNDTSGECLIYTRRIAADGTPDAGGRVLVSDAGALELRLRLVVRPGGYALFAESFPEEIGRYHLDANGAPDGLGVTPVSALDGRRSGRPRVASDGTRALVVWSESATTMEIAGRLSDGATGTLQPQVTFTSGHDPANTASVVVPGQPRVASLGGGFASVWQEPDSGSNLIHGRLYGANGQLVTDLAPLSATASSGRPGLATVGSTFAVAWRAPGNVLRFARYGANGAVLVPEATIATGVGSGGVELEWNGEAYYVLYPQGNTVRYVRVTDAGVAAPPVTLALGLTFNSNPARAAWMGDGFALVLRSTTDASLKWARFASDGTILLPLTDLTTATAPPSGTAADVGLVYDGTTLGLTWSETRGADPPGQDIYFTTLNRNGTKGFPDAALVMSPGFEGPAQLHFANGRFHLVYLADNEGTSGMRELDIDLVPGGAAVAGSRYLANRGSSAIATVHDGATLALAWRMNPSHDVHVETDACLADPTPPPCPSVSVASFANNVRLTWPAVADPESGLWRYHVYRDNAILAELPSTATQYDDSGYDTVVTHGYSVRALNRAFLESAACPTLNFSTRVGDANGNGVLDVADIFYLINFLLGDGAPPIGDGDANGDGSVSPTDIFFLINYFFGGGPLPTLAATGSVP